MTDLELIKKLNSLKKIGPDENWLKSNRELLLSQVSNSGAERLAAWKIFLIDFTSALKSAAQPAYALGAFILLLLGGTLYSREFLAQTKPNDSLYIARVISEKVKLNATFNSADRDKLAAQFAAERAQDISAVLADPKFNTEANKDEVAKLNDTFKSEVNTVKNSISRLPKAATSAVAPAGNNDEVIIADNSKDSERIQVAEKSASSASATVSPSLSATISPTATAVATSATTTEATSSVPAEVTPAAEADRILDEATQLFNQKDYTKASDKLKEVDQIIK